MNRIPAAQYRKRRPFAVAEQPFRRLLAASAAAAALVCGTSIAQSVQTEPAEYRTYELDYVVKPDPAAGGAWVEMRLRQSSNLLREVDMRAPAEKISSAAGDGEISSSNGRLVWNPPPRGGNLRWFSRIDHQRDSGSYDARIDASWAMFRAEDVIPQARTRTLRDARSQTTLRFDLPAGWSSLTEYFGRDHAYRVTNPDRRFDRPAGWIILGNIGVRYDRIAGIRVNVAAPAGHGMRRNDILALLSWTLPEVLRLFPDFPERLTIIGAGDPMWRGGLSGPRSLFMHTDRPLISENGTSTLLHELVHIALGRAAADGMDWIVEGLAEYYSITLLHRSGTITDKRHSTAMRKQADWGSSVRQLCRAASGGAVTARAVTIMSALDKEIRTKTGGKKSLDDVVVELTASDDPLTFERFAEIARGISNSELTALRASKLPGCDK